MSLAAQFRDLARYNRWMNDRLYAVAATLADTDRKRDAGAFFGSIHRTLNHLLLTDRAWLGRIVRDATLAESRDADGRPIAMSGRLDQEVYADFEQLRGERVRTDADLIAWANTLDDAMLAAPIRYRTSKGEACEHALWWAVTHLFNHQTHHRGQVTTLLHQLGHDPGVTDLIAFLRSPARAG